MSKLKAKITVRCPYCAFEQLEPPLVRSTYCRECSEYFTVVPSVIVTGAAPAAPLVPRGPRLVAPGVPAAAPLPAAPMASASAPPAPALESAEEAPDTFTHEISSAAAALPPPSAVDTPPLASPAPAPAAHPASRDSLRERFGQWLGGPPKHQMVRCFECDGAQEVSGAAHSTICKDCGAYVDLQDYKITGSFSRNIVTRGAVTLMKGGDLSSSKVVCTAATLLGRMRGNLLCSGKVTIRFRGKMHGTLEAGYLVVEKGAELDFARPVRVSTLDIHGAVRGQIFCEGHVTVYKTGQLSGPVAAKGFSVEKGGGFEGELTVRPRTSLSTAPAAPGNDQPEEISRAGNPVETPSLEPRRVWTESSGLIDQDPLPS